MGCACEAVHGFPCQFPDETEFHAFDGRDWCLFHLPLEDAEGNKSPKDGWEEGEPDWRRFRNVVFERLRNPRDESSNPSIRHRVSDLRAVVFPHYFDFTTVEDTTLYPDFTDATFGDYPEFTGATFGDRPEFTGATFGISPGFAGATFGYLAVFSGATFGDHAVFSGATFGDFARFGGATFGYDAEFDGTTFGRAANFADAVFIGSAFFQASSEAPEKQRFSHVSFNGTEFRGYCSFENRQFSAAASFANATFHDLVAFHGCKFHQGISFFGTKFLATRGIDDQETEELERAYRTLKLAMEELRARNEEARFFALEMECHRQRGDVPRLERAFASLYKQVSEYGQSISRPLVYLFVSLGAFALLYWITGMLTNPWLLLVQGQFLYDLAILTLEQLVKPFSVWTRSSSSAQLPLVENNPLLLPILASLQSLFNLSLIAVFLLALRRRFKMD